MKINKLFIITIIFILIICCNNKIFSAIKQTKIVQAKINNNLVSLEVVSSEKDKENGLMNRQSLNENQGMLFLFDKPQQVYFWMKNVNFPLDFLFIKKNKIVTISSQVPVCKNNTCPIYPSIQPVDSVIELSAGFCSKYNIKVGQKILILNKVNDIFEK